MIIQSKISFLIFCILFLNLSFSQNDGRTLSNQNRELLNELQEQRAERLSRVSSFLQANPDVEPSLSEGDKITYIYDVYDGNPIFKTTYNAEAANGMQTSKLQPGGSTGLNLTGGSLTVGVWDGGPAQDTHQEFANADNTSSRVEIIDNATVDGDSGFSSHATHVAGTVGAKGVDPDARGMATEINIKSYNWSNDKSEMITASNASDPILISNHSYGVPINTNNGQTDAWVMGAYNQEARNIDQIAKNNPQYLIVASAGNSGQVSYTGGLFSGYDKLTSDKNAKNNLVVANANPTLEPFSGDVQAVNINSGSSQGPTDDLRIKPDIAGDGTGVYSSVPDNNYATFNGTSMSAPGVAGSLALLQEYYQQLNGGYMNASTLKGLVCHTAVDNSTEPGPDPSFGWGFLDTKASADVIAADNNNTAVIDEVTLDNNGTYTLTFSAQAGEELKATICWTDMAGDAVANGTLNDQTPRLVNDLDLRVSNDQQTFQPWKLDYDPSNGFSNSKGDNNVDNIERVDIDTPSSGVYTVTVDHKGTLSDNEGGPFDPGSQDFSIIITGKNLTLSNQQFEDISFDVWPNPTTDIVNIKSQISGEVDYKLYDLKGSQLIKGSLDNGNGQVNVQNLQRGVYIIKLINDNRSSVQKIIKK